jgi:hypothetical protein
VGHASAGVRTAGRDDPRPPRRNVVGDFRGCSAGHRVMWRLLDVPALSNLLDNAIS